MKNIHDDIRAAQIRDVQKAASAKKPFVAKGHDAILKKYQDTKQVVEISLITNATMEGVITARDKFTITIKDSVTGVSHTIYKHAIESFCSLEIEQ